VQIALASLTYRTAEILNSTIVNLATARALSLTMSETLLLRAKEIIE
jgi:hypothetical protein